MASITFNNLSKADGSALIDQDNTLVQAAVFGPVDVAQSKMNYEEAVVEIFFKPKVSISNTHPSFDQIREIENLLRAIFKEVILTRLHPRTSISILVQEIYNGGSLLSSTINAVCCALIDAGVSMKSPVSGVSISNSKAQDKTFRSEPGETRFDLVFNNELDIVSVIARGQIDQKCLDKAIKEGREEAKINFDTMRKKIKERFTLNEQLAVQQTTG